MNFFAASILYVDDDKDSCELMELMLHQSEASFEVKSVSTVREALSLIEKQSFDFYILDYALTDGAGTELCRKIRQKDSQTPIMFFSAMARDVDRQRAMAAGASEYLVKPNDLERFTKTVKRLLSETSSNGERKTPNKTKIRDRIF